MNKKKKEYSKSLLIQESALIWVLTLSTLGLGYLCIKEQYLGALPWLAAMVTCAWGAYGVSQVYYYKKSRAENTEGGVVFQSMMNEAEKVSSQYQDSEALNFDEDLSSEAYDSNSDETYQI